MNTHAGDANSALGLETGVVRVVPYDPAWPQLFAAEAERLQSLLADGHLSLVLEHTGSTAVPGLAAKPILDILAGYPAGADVRDYVDGFTAAGYVHRGEQDIPGHEFFRRGVPRAYHVHLVAEGSPFWQDHLAFRDRLRADPSLRDGYAQLKHDLASQYPRDREAYIAAKGPFVRQVLSALCVAFLFTLPACSRAQRRDMPGESTDEAAIRAERARSNQAIAAHDPVTLASAWLPEFWLVSSTNAQSAGRDAARARFVELFAARPDVVFVREPDRVEVNSAWRQAAESGRWTGRWTQADGVTRVGGSYYAKWRKVDGGWLLLAEVFVQNSCTGTSYCSQPP